MKLRQIATCMVAGLFMTGTVGSDDTAPDAEEKTKLDAALEKYEKNGERKRCLNPTRIRNSNVIDDYHIIFEISARKAYLSKLPRRCPSLGYNRSIQYTVRGGSICKGDLFQVFDPNGIPGISCNFGEFEELKLKQDKPEAG